MIADKPTPVPFRGHPGGFPRDDVLHELRVEEIAADLAYGDLQWQYPYLDIRRYGGDPSGVYPSDNDTAIENAVRAARQRIALGVGWEAGPTGDAWNAPIAFPAGMFNVTKGFVVPSGVGFVGQGSRSTVIRAHSTWGADTFAFTFDDGDDLLGAGTTASYAQFFKGINLQYGEPHCSGITKCIITHAWQEDSGMAHVVIGVHENSTAISIESGVGGCARTGFFDDVTIFGDATNNSVAAIDCDSSGVFALNVRNCTISFFTDGIRMRGDRLRLEAVHFEGCDDGVSMEGTASVHATFVDGLSNVTNVFRFASATNHGLLEMCSANGATNLVKDDWSARDLGNVSVTSYSYPSVEGKTDDATPSLINRPSSLILSGTTTLTGFDDVHEGQECLVIFNGSITVDFTGTDLRGNGGVDLNAVAGDFMRIKVENGLIYCTVELG